LKYEDLRNLGVCGLNVFLLKNSIGKISRGGKTVSYCHRILVLTISIDGFPGWLREGVYSKLRTFALEEFEQNV